MIVEGYSMDLYCEVCDESIRTGDIDRARCVKGLRKMGWVINDKERTCFCPKHAKIKDRQP